MKKIPLNRRQFVLGTATATAFGSKLSADTVVGDWTVTSLSDGSISLPANLVLEPLGESDVVDLKKRFELSEVLTPACNVTLLQNGERTVLVDVGAGQEFQPTAGRLLDSLDELGVAPDDVTDVILTHAHPDHVWGLLDDFDDLAFWNAAYQIGRVEWDYWTNPNTVDAIGEERTAFAVGAARRLDRIGDQVKFFEDGEEVLPGVAARATFGHTPGHMAFEVRSGSESLMVLGDCIANHHVALAHPGWESGSDQDQQTAAATRLGLLDQIASEQIQVLGFHLPGDGLGRIEKKGDGYQFVPS